MRLKIFSTAILLMLFAFSMACSINLGSDTDSETVSAKTRENNEKSSEKESKETEEKAEIQSKDKDKSERKSLLQSDNDYDPVGATKADDYYNNTYLNQDGGRIRFKRGESSAVVSGKIKNGNNVTYVVGAKAGQTLYVNITDGGENTDVVFQIIAPNGETAGSEGDDLHTTWRGELPQSGDYKIVFGAFESTNINFTFYVSID